MPIVILALGAAGAFAAYRFLAKEARHAADLRAEMDAENARRDADVGRLVREPGTDIWRPETSLLQN